MGWMCCCLGSTGMDEAGMLACGMAGCGMGMLMPVGAP